MKSKLLAMVVISTIAFPAWSAGKERANKLEAAGVGSGVVIGAAAGGPIGAIIGAALGGKLGDRFHQEKTARIEMAERYSAEQERVRVLQADADTLESQLQSSQRRMSDLEKQMRDEEASYRAAIQEALNTQIFFRTGESQLSEASVENLDRMAELIGSLDGFVIRLEGHADSRGDESYNETLSEQRAIAVRDALVGAGFPENRIVVDASGERFSQAEEKDLDALAMERRVHIQLIGTDRMSSVARQ